MDPSCFLPLARLTQTAYASLQQASPTWRSDNVAARRTAIALHTAVHRHQHFGRAAHSRAVLQILRSTELIETLCKALHICHYPPHQDQGHPADACLDDAAEAANAALAVINTVISALVACESCDDATRGVLLRQVPKLSLLSFLPALPLLLSLGPGH